MLSCGVRPHISRLLGCWPPSSVLASCSPFRVRNSVFPSPPGGPRDLEGIAPLTAFRVTPRPSSGRRARAGARPLSPAPRSRPSSRCPGGRRPLAPLLLSPPGRESAAHRPGTRRGAGAAPNRPRITSAPLSRFPESLFPLHSPQPLGEPRRDEGFPHSLSWRGQAPSVGWGSSYEGRWQPELIQPPWSGARTPAEEGGSIWSHGWRLSESGSEGSSLQHP